MPTACAPIKNAIGLHARPAAKMAETASKFKSDIRIKNMDKNTEGINAKSIIRILSLNATMGTQIEISATGEDEEAAVQTLVALIDSGFGEE